MHEPALPHLIVGIVAYNSETVIARTLEAVLAQDYPSFQVLVVDNASTDRTRAIVTEQFRGVRLVPLATNNGPNAARNRIVEAAGSGLVLILDDDCAPRPGALRRLVETALEHPDGAAFGARVVYSKEPRRIQFEGALVHFLGEAVQLNSERCVDDVPATPRQVTGLGAGCLLLRADRWSEVGGFDEYLVFGREDGEFVQRLQIGGYKAFVEPRAVVLHDYEPRGLKASFYQIRNRWLVILGLYRLRTLLLLAPALLLHELVIATFMTLEGRLGTYLRATAAVVCSLPQVLTKRRLVRGFRRMPDSAFLGVGPIAVRGDLLDTNSWKARFKALLDRFYAGYWRLVRPLV
jgi:GT2 family glycosyltransferase